MSTIKHDPDEPLPSTARFVTGLGIFIAVGWALMFVLLWERWY